MRETRFLLISWPVVRAPTPALGGVNQVYLPGSGRARNFPAISRLLLPGRDFLGNAGRLTPSPDLHLAQRAPARRAFLRVIFQLHPACLARGEREALALRGLGTKRVSESCPNSFRSIPRCLFDSAGFDVARRCCVRVSRPKMSMGKAGSLRRKRYRYPDRPRPARPYRCL